MTRWPFMSPLAKPKAHITHTQDQFDELVRLFGQFDRQVLETREERIDAELARIPKQRPEPGGRWLDAEPPAQETFTGYVCWLPRRAPWEAP